MSLSDASKLLAVTPTEEHSSSTLREQLNKHCKRLEALISYHEITSTDMRGCSKALASRSGLLKSRKYSVGDLLSKREGLLRMEAEFKQMLDYFEKVYLSEGNRSEEVAEVKEEEKKMINRREERQTDQKNRLVF